MFDTLTRMGSSAAGAYEIERSLRFNRSDSPGFTRTSIGTPSDDEIATWSAWIKLQGWQKGNNAGERAIFGGRNDSTGTNNFWFNINNDDIFVFYAKNSSNSVVFDMRTNRRFMDYAGWLHVFVVYDSTQGTAANRIKIYFNGVQETGGWTTESYPSQNVTIPSWCESGENQYIGIEGATNSESFDGYLADVYYIDGQAKAVTDFGAADPTTGQWLPKKYSGTYGNNGFFLNFSDNSNTTAATLGKDSSGNGHNFTPSNFSVAAGAGNDSVFDSPTNNYCIIDTSDAADSIITDGGLATATTSGGGHHPNFSTFGVTSGKWYVEGGTISGSSNSVCVWPKEHDTTSLHQDCAVHNNGSATNAKGYSLNLQYGSASDSDDATVSSYVSTSFTTWMLALDLDNNKIWWGVDGTWGNNGGTGDPAAGSNPAFSSIRDELWSIGSMTTNGHNMSFNFGQQGFTHTPPTGFKALCTQNLPDPPIKDPSKYFNTVIYDGDGQDNRTVTGVGFDPDLIWVKETTGTGGSTVSDWLIQDTNKGITWSGNSNNRDAWTNDSRVKSTNSDGFVTGNDNTINGSSKDYVAWNWLESATAGFDIVKYDGTGVNRTVAHSLGVAPDMMLFKNTEQDTQEWGIYHKDVGNQIVTFLDDNSLGLDNPIFWNDTSPTSSVFTVGTADTVNGNTSNVEEIVGYLWASVDGYSRFGIAYGSGQKDEGPFVWTGFRPAFVLTKGFNGSSTWANNANWSLWDNKRSPGGWGGNYKNSPLYPDNASGNENYNPDTAASPVCEFHAHGFRYYTNHSYVNPYGKPFYYMAFAETPFKYANSQ